MQIKKILLYAMVMVTAFFVILFVSGCASRGGAPIETISSAELAIKEAEESNAAINAPLELKLAEDKLKEAKEAVTEEEFDKARRLAEQALTDAKLAETKSLSKKAKDMAQEMRDSIETMQREIERAQKLKQQ